jgi:hypothetical protein
LHSLRGTGIVASVRLVSHPLRILGKVTPVALAGPATARRTRRALPPGETPMPKFMSSHTLPAGKLSRQQVDELAQAAQKDPTVKPYRSFMNLSEGKVFCVMEAPNRDALSAWFKKMNMPCDHITPVELEGECGKMCDA